MTRATSSLEDLLIEQALTLTPDGRVYGSDIPSSGGLFVGPGDPTRIELARHWMGDCLWWIGAQVTPGRPWHAIISSRTGRHPEQHPPWIRLLQSSLHDALRCNALLVIPQGSLVATWVLHAAELFGLDWVEVEVAGASESLPGWCRRMCKNAPKGICISPPLEPVTELRPRRDCFAVGLSEQVTCLHVRSGGHLENLLRQRLRESHHAIGSVRVGVETIRQDAAAVSLMESGAVGWYDASQIECDPRLVNRIESANTQTPTLEQFLLTRGESLDQDSWPYLVHCTRAANGPWPDESPRGWRDRMLLATGSERDDALGSLIRIMRQQVIWGTHRVTRGNAVVVCLSALSLPNLIGRRTFRSHLGRWDYEPFGIAVRREAFVALGGRPAIYGNADDFQRLSLDEQRFFQHRGERYDWTEELEWRVPLKLSFGELAASDFFAFVPDDLSAEQLRPFASDIPIVRVS